MCRQSKSEGSCRVHKLVNNKGSTPDWPVLSAVKMACLWHECDFCCVCTCVCMQMCVSVLSMVTRWIIHCLLMKKHLGSLEWCSETGLTSLLLPSPSLSFSCFPIPLSWCLFLTEAVRTNVTPLWAVAEMCEFKSLCAFSSVFLLVWSCWPSWETMFWW